MVGKHEEYPESDEFFRVLVAGFGDLPAELQNITRQKLFAVVARQQDIPPCDDLVRLFQLVEPSLASEISKLEYISCLLYTSPSPRDQRGSRMPSSA